MLTVRPAPEVADIEEIVCSDEPIDVTLAASDVACMDIDSFDVVIVSTGGDLVVVGTQTTGTGLTDVSAISEDTYTNTSGEADTVVYSVTPYVDGCEGDAYDVTVVISTEPVGTDTEISLSSDEMLDVNLDELISNGVTDVTFEWSAEENENVTGETTVTQTSSTIGDVLTNTSGSTQVVVYTVTVTSEDGCVGDEFTVTVTICSEPIYLDDVVSACSDEMLDISITDLLDTDNNSNAADGFTYTVESSDSDAVAAGAARTDSTLANITDTYTNTSASSVSITYTITPHTDEGCSGDEFTITVTIDPAPVLADDLDDTVCSESPIGLVLSTSGTSVAADSYDFVSVNAGGLSVLNSTEVGEIAADGLANDAYENTGASSVDVTYMVAPMSADGCIGDTISIVITVDPEVTVNAGTDETICSTAEVALTDATISGGGVSSGSWSSDGDGTFVDVDGETRQNLETRLYMSQVKVIDLEEMLC